MLTLQFTEDMSEAQVIRLARLLDAYITERFGANAVAAVTPRSVVVAVQEDRRAAPERPAIDAPSLFKQEPVALAMPPVPPPAAIDPPPAPREGPADPAPSQPTVSATFDIRGLPWDARIHAGSKAKLKSGEWRTKRGVSEALVGQVEAELNRKYGAAPAVSEPVAPAVSEPVAPAVSEPVAPAVSEPETERRTAPEGEGVVPRSYSELIQLVTRLIMQEPSRADTITSLLHENGYAAVPMLAEKDATTIGTVYALIEAQVQ